MLNLQRSDSLAHGLYEVIVSRDGGGDNAELVPLVALQDGQHGRGLVLDGRRQLQPQRRVRRALLETAVVGVPCDHLRMTTILLLARMNNISSWISSRRYEVFMSSKVKDVC